jgi:hypothetical protein
MYGDQTLLFPISPRELAKDVGIPWSQVLALRENKLLSFDPEETNPENLSLTLDFNENTLRMGYGTLKAFEKLKEVPQSNGLMAC